MPELPEVETMRRGVLPVVGGRITGIVRPRCRLKPIGLAPQLAAFRRRSVGKQIVDVGRVGKRVVLQLDDDARIVLEPRMTGLVLLAEPPNEEHLRLRIQLMGVAPAELLFWDRRGLGSVRLYSGEAFQQTFGLHYLGPDALEATPEQLRERLGASRRAIKVALLDQKAVAGIGNLYASEILHVCRIHPERPCCSLRPADWRKLHAATGEVLRQAIRYEGSTLGDGTYRNALNQEGSYQNHHRVYNREGEACPRCRAVIVRSVQAQRSTFHCPRCQRKGRWAVGAK